VVGVGRTLTYLRGQKVKRPKRFFKRDAGD